MKSKGKEKPSSMPQKKEETGAASYSRKRIKGNRTSSEASRPQTSRLKLDSYRENAENKAGRATETGSLSEKEQLTISTTTDHSVAIGDEKVVGNEASGSVMINKIHTELKNVEEQSDEKNASCQKYQNNSHIQNNPSPNSESPSSVSGGVANVGNSGDCKDVDRTKNILNKGTSYGGQFSSGNLDREKGIPVEESEASKEGRDRSDNSLVASKATVVEMSTKIAEIPPDVAITCNKKEETNSDSEISVESQDVKVCDICGDAGQEDLLAVCSRCSDGAEHTYCMRVRLDKIPQGDWLCEGCKLKEEAENQQENSEAEDKIINEPCSAENSQCTGQTLYSNSAAETHGPLPVATGNMKELLSTAMSTLRKLKKLDSSSMNGEKTTEATCKPTNTISRENDSMAEQKSIHESDMIKPEPFQLATSRDKSENILGQQHPTSSDLVKVHSGVEPRGTLTKSFSFNYPKVPKVKPLMEDVPQMQKITKEPFVNNNHKGLLQATTKLTSLKNTRNHISGNSTETIGKMQSHNLQLHQGRRAKEMKETNTVDKKSSSLLNVASVSPISGVGISSKNIESVFHDVKVNKPSDSNHSGAKIGLTGASSLAPSEVKQTHFSILMDGGNKSHKGRDGMEVARIERKSDSPSQSIEASASSIDKNSEAPVKSVSSNSSSVPTRMLKKEVSSHAQVVMGNPCTDPLKSAAGIHVQQIGTDSKIPAFAPVKSNRNAVLNVVDKWSVKPNPQISVELASFLSQPFQAAIIPEHEYIWQGTFLVLRTGKHPRTHDGFQAHLSTAVSTKAIEVANMFPSKLQLEEVPRQTSWPLQFKENCPKEDNITFFFFAKDITSYKYHYQKLVDNMMKNDLALRGNINSVELLIFPSNILPKGYQQWNKMIFLWGVYKEKRTNCTVDLDVNKNPSLLELNVPNVVEDLSTHTAVQAVSSDNIISDSTLKGRLLKDFENDSLSNMEHGIASSRTGKDRNYEINESHCHTKTFYQDASAENALAEQASCSSENISNHKEFSISSTKPKIQIDIEQLPLETEDNSSYLDKHGDSDAKERVACAHNVSADGKITEQKIKLEDVSTESLKVSSYGLSKNESETKNYSWGSRLNLKRTHSSLEETTVSVHRTTDANVEMKPPNHTNDGKKIKINSDKLSSNFSFEDDATVMESSEFQSSLSTLTPNSSCTGKFPESSEASISLLKNKDSLDSNSPDLELVLGGNNRVGKQVKVQTSAPKMPSDYIHDKLVTAPVNDLDDESGSLSLSLAFPNSARKNIDKSMSHSKQLFPDKTHIS